MIRKQSVIAGVTAAGLLFSPVAAYATEVENNPAETIKALNSSEPEYVKVLILAKDQPTRPGGELLNLRDVKKLRDYLVEKYDIKPDRSFGYLVKGLAALVPEDKLADLANDPKVGSVERTRTYQPLMGSAGDLTFSTNARKDFGVDGQGIVVSVIDTGIDIHHQDMILSEGAATKLQPAAGFTPKVPWGYNYADDNNEVKDHTSSQHGMHVAGIVAANGGAADASPFTNGRINGIAPNAQVLAMKVFPNEASKGSGASTEDIIAALEDSVKHGADIINMSLGSPNGFSGSTEGEQRAVKLATDAGVEVIVAAGNEGLNFSPSGGTDDALGLLDDGTVGSPSTATTALSVASIDNKISVGNAAKAVQGDKTDSFIYNLQVGTPDETPRRVVYGGLGKPGEVPAEANGNYVLIKRGEIAFSAKFEEAIKQGAVGVIVYNHEQGGEEVPGMAGIDGFNIVGVGMTHSTGARLKAMIDAGETTLAFSNTPTPSPVANASRPSSFTSWGSPSSLEFKPQVAGVGGEVWSTFNDNKYANSSGTSMAAPHVAGATALILQKTKLKYPDLSPAELNELNRIALANTAQILQDENGVPFSPRQMGAGLINTKAALTTDVFATVEGAPWVSLKEVTAPESFTVTLVNKGKEDRSYVTGGTCIVNETNVAGEATTTFCNTAETLSASVSDVTVPAGGSATVTFTLSPSATQAHWLGAWAQFTSLDKNVPALSIPILGFAGDWNAEKIIDAPAGNPSVFDVLYNSAAENPNHTTLASKTTGNKEVTWTSGQDFWISPNGDGDRDNLLPKVVMLRNAKEIKGSILDAKGNVVRELGKESYVSRHGMKEYSSDTPRVLKTLNQISFDGRVYNKKSGEFEYLPDGDYTYRLAAKLDDEFAPQVTDFTFKVDGNAPEVEFESVAKDQGTGNVLVTFTATENANGSGISFAGLVLNGQYQLPAKQGPNGKYVATIPANVLSLITSIHLYVEDVAGNTYIDELQTSVSPLAVDADNEWREPVIGLGSKSGFYNELVVKEGKRRISGTVTDPVTSVTVNDVDVPVTNGKWETLVPVTENADNAVVVRGLGGTQPEEETYRFYYDAQAPTLEIPGATRDNATGTYSIERDPSGTIRVAGNVADNRANPPKVTVTVVGAGRGVAVPVTGGQFVFERQVPESVNLLLVEVNDGVNAITEIVRVSNGVFASGAKLIFGDLDTADINIISRDDQNVTFENGKYYYNWEGILGSLPQGLVIDGNEVAFNPVAGNFTYKIELKQGITPVNVKLTDKTGEVIHDTSLKILFDSVLPVYELEKGKPQLDEDGALYLKEAGDVRFKGKVSDNAFGYALALNGHIIENVLSIFDPTQAATEREFDYTTRGEDGDLFLLGLYDQFGNFTERKIPVVVDSGLPVNSLTGVEEGALYQTAPGAQTVTKQVTVKVQDKNVKSLRVTLNGTEVATRVVDVKAHPQAALTQEGDVTVGDRQGTGVAPLDPSRGEGLNAAQPASAATPAEAPAEGGAAGEAAPAQPAPDANAVADVAADRAAEVANENAAAAPAAAPETELAVTLEVEAPVGDNTLVLEGNDKAGNLTATVVNFKVEAVAAPDKPDTADPDKEQPGGEQPGGEQPGGEQPGSGEGNTDGPAEGDGPKTDSKPDAKTEEVVTARAESKGIALIGAAVALKGTKLEITPVEDAEGIVFKVASNLTFETAFALEGAAEPIRVDITYPDGRVESVVPQLLGSEYVFAAPSNGTFRVVKLSAPLPKAENGAGTGSSIIDLVIPPVGDPTTDAPAEAGQGESGKAAPGVANEGGLEAGQAKSDTAASGKSVVRPLAEANVTAAGHPRALSNTGAYAGSALALSALLLVAGGLLVATRTRRH